ncbi:MAG: DNA translocase FtsK 4TM domain-containing protein [Prevotella sp.]|nr:DNA translocase FtsK 4TM domain-containing protein [Prevotella sp.]
MAKKTKKSAKNSEKHLTFLESLGLSRISQIFQNERLWFFIGMVLFATSCCMVLAFISFFSTGQADVSMIENLRSGEMANQNGEFQNACGSLGAYTAYFFIKQCFGIPAFLVPVLLLLVSLRLMKAFKPNLLKWFMCLMLVMIWTSITLAKFAAPFFAESHFSPGGDHGRQVGRWIEGFVGTPGLTAILVIIALLFLTYVSTETYEWVRKILNPKKFIDKVKFIVVAGSGGENTDDYKPLVQTAGGGPAIVEDPTVFDDPTTQTVEFDGDNVRTSIDIPIGPVRTPRKKKEGEDVGLDVEAGSEEEKADGKDLVSVGDKELEPYDPKRDLENYHYPTLDLLKHYDDDGKPYIDMAEQTANKNRIVQVLRTFGVEISSIKATVGPTITLYEITPAEGVRIAKIRNLEDDIALSLAAEGIRIIAPIPGRGTIGIEVPNAKKSIVSMESVLNSKKFQESTMELPCAMGKTITNEVYMFDLAKSPHLLVAGATGQGKSVGLNAILTSLLYKKHPAELKIVLVDPKMVEFSIYRTIDHHFLAALPEEFDNPIITDTSKVIRTLQSLCVEMDSRYELLKDADVRNIKEYNAKFIARQLNPEKGHKFMPYIVVVIDEYGDLIMTAGKEIELPIARIAQKARAVGIHMIIATQRPTTNIITGTIKANFPARIAFKVSQGIDSKTILDRMGAQQLIGRGDMLYLQGNDPVRVQCAFVDTPEVIAINKFIQAQQGYIEPFELPEPIMEGGDGEIGSGADDVDLNHLDPMFDDAARLIVQSGSGSTSLIQRKFSIGYNRAGRLMDMLEKAGVVGQAHGSKPREVLIQDEMSLEQLLQSLRK